LCHRRDGKRSGDPGSGQVKALKSRADQVGPFDEVPHEDEERYRDQNVVVHNGIGPLRYQIEYVSHRGLRILGCNKRKRRNKRSHPHQGKGGGKAEQ